MAEHKRFSRKAKAFLTLLFVAAVTVLAAMLYADFYTAASSVFTTTVPIFGLQLSLLLLVELVILTIGLFWAVRILHRWLAAQLREWVDFDPMVRDWLTNASEMVLYVLAAICILSFLGINVTTLAVFTGALGVALGIGLQKVASNYVSGIILLFDQSVQVGDIVEIDGGPLGRIERLEPRSTHLVCEDGREVTVPNEEFITKKLTNWSRSNALGLNPIILGVSYGVDVERVRQIMLEAAKEYAPCLTQPAPRCDIQNFGLRAIRLRLLFWTAPTVTTKFWNHDVARSEVMSKILRKLAEAKIELVSQL